MHFFTISFALISLAAGVMLPAPTPISCTTPEGKGTCASTSSCTGFSVAGYCPGPSDFQCCISKSCSTPSGSGSCKNTGNGCSGGSFISNYCPGPSDVECCVKDAEPTCSTPSGSGTCKLTSAGCSGGSFIPGYCPGPANEQCCVKQAAPTCSTPSGSGTCKLTGAGCSGGSFIPGYCPGPADEQCCVIGAAPTCSTPSGAGTCKLISAGCSGGSFIPGYCPGPANEECCVKGGSGFGAPISRSEIVARGLNWIDKHVPYSQDATYPDPEGTEYRTDCSGFVSMCIHISPPGLSTVYLPEVAVKISWDDLQPGDFVGTLGPGTGGDDGHVTLFHSWVDPSTKTRYNSLECRGKAYGCIPYERPIAWVDGSFTAEPYRYTNVE